MIRTASSVTRKREARGLLLELHAQAQYGLLVGSLLVLAATGLPQKFDSLGLSTWLMDSVGGIENLRLIHHIAGGVLIFTAVYHVALVIAAVLALKLMTPLQMIPDAKDLRDALQTVRYFLGSRRESVTFGGRPSYFQKLDYWLLVWSIGMMGTFGLISLFPVRAARLLSGEVVLTILRVHSDAAILIVAWALIVHVIYASLAPWLFNDGASILSGRIGGAGSSVVAASQSSARADPIATAGNPGIDKLPGDESERTVGTRPHQDEDARGDPELG
jgi:hypothetical protein